jgi:hypothetical protein
MKLANSFSSHDLAQFTAPYKRLLQDRRLFESFNACVWGIIGSGSCKVSQMAASNPLTAKVEHGERRLRRLVHGGNKRADVSAEALAMVLSEEGAKRLKGEHEVLLIVDESDLRKPFASELEYLDTVRDLAGELVTGFHTLSILGIGESGVRALLYQTSFSTQAPGFVSVNETYRKALAQVSKALRDQSVGRLLWVMDRGFDDSKLLNWIHERGECFVVRSQPSKRRAKVRLDGPTKPLQTLLDDTAVVGQVALEKRLFTKTRGKAVAHVDVRVLSALLEQLPGTHLSVVQLSHPKLAKPWSLLSNLRLPDGKPASLDLAARMVQAYRQRWSIEDLFAWTKDALDWESVRVLDYAALRTLVSFAWIAAAFIFHLTDSLDRPEVLFLARLGGWIPGKDKPGKAALTRGLARLAHFLVVNQHLGNPHTALTLYSLMRELRVPDKLT